LPVFLPRLYIPHVQAHLLLLITGVTDNHHPKTDTLYRDIERRYQKRYNKLFADACEVEHRHLTGLTEALAKEFKVDKEKIKTIMETFGEATENLYLYVKQNRYTI